MALWRNYTKDQIETIVANSFSYREVALKLGYNPNSGSVPTIIKNMIGELGLDVKHFKHQGWNAGTCDYSRFRKGNRIKSSELLRGLILLRGRKCERCGKTEWLLQDIPLEVHHKDEDSLNNEIDNLELLCRNCHALTDNFKGKANKEARKVTDDEFITALMSSPNVYQALSKLSLTPKGGNYKRAYDLINKHGIKFTNT